MNAAAEKINSLEKQLESQIKDNSVHECEVTKQKEQLEMMEMEQEELRQEMEHERKAAAERERNLHIELEELKVKLHTNLELVAKLKAEEEEKQTLLKDCNQEKMELTKQLEETKHQLAHQQNQENLLVLKEKEVRAKLEKLTAAFNQLHKAAFTVHDACSNVEEKCRADINAEEEKTKAAVEREKTLRIELEELKVKLHQETSRNLELVAKIKADQEKKQDLHKNSVQIMEELKVEVNGQRESPSSSHKLQHVKEEAPSTSHEPEHQEEVHVIEEKVPEKKKKKSLFWFKKKKRQQSPHPLLTLTSPNK
ncbi:hypothetical protein PAMP_010369 [Pampus punctatissimus]